MAVAEKARRTRAERAREKLIEHWLEILATAVLALGSVIAAWSANQAALWGGVQSASFNQASLKRTEANQLTASADKVLLLDLATFDSYAEAFNRGDTRLAQFYERRFRPEFRVAFDAWLATNPLSDVSAPASPVLMPEYRIAEAERAAQLTAEAEQLLAGVERADTISAAYTTNGFITALALFFAGIAPRFSWRPLKIIVVVIALLTMFYAAGMLFSYPAQAITLFV
jgi:hypothetical protein